MAMQYSAQPECAILRRRYIAKVGYILGPIRLAAVLGLAGPAKIATWLGGQLAITQLAAVTDLQESNAIDILKDL